MMWAILIFLGGIPSIREDVRESFFYIIASVLLTSCVFIWNILAWPYRRLGEKDGELAALRPRKSPIEIVFFDNEMEESPQGGEYLRVEQWNDVSEGVSYFNHTFCVGVRNAGIATLRNVCVKVNLVELGLHKQRPLLNATLGEIDSGQVLVSLVPQEERYFLIGHVLRKQSSGGRLLGGSPMDLPFWVRQAMSNWTEQFVLLVQKNGMQERKLLRVTQELEITAQADDVPPQMLRLFQRTSRFHPNLSAGDVSSRGSQS